jgi:hypothetical protein
MQTKEIKEKLWSPAPADRTKYPERAFIQCTNHFRFFIAERRK